MLTPPQKSSPAATCLLLVLPGGGHAHASVRKYIPLRTSRFPLQEGATTSPQLQKTAMPEPATMRETCSRLSKHPLTGVASLALFHLRQGSYPRPPSRRGTRPSLDGSRLYLHRQPLPSAAPTSLLLQPSPCLHMKTAACLIPAAVARLFPSRLRPDFPPSPRWPRSLAESVLSLIPLFLLLRIPTACFVRALPTQSRFHTFLLLLPFIVHLP